MNSDYKVGDLIYDANIYDGMNTDLSDLQFYKSVVLPQNKGCPKYSNFVVEQAGLLLPIARDGYNISGVDYTPLNAYQARLQSFRGRLKSNFIGGRISQEL